MDIIEPDESPDEKSTYNSVLFVPGEMVNKETCQILPNLVKICQILIISILCKISSKKLLKSVRKRFSIKKYTKLHVFIKQKVSLIKIAKL